jgi:hypothetical protein
MIFNNMEKSGGSYDKWNKQGTERWILHSLTYMQTLKGLSS